MSGSNGTRTADMQGSHGQTAPSATYKLPAVYMNNGKQVEADKRQKEGKVGRLWGDRSEQNKCSGIRDQKDPLWLQSRGLSCAGSITTKVTK